MVFHGVKFVLERNVSNHFLVQHGGFYSTGLQYDSRFIDFSSNVNPLGFPPSVTKIIQKNRSLLSFYPDPDSSKLRNDLQKYTGIQKSHITVGNGATEIIYNFCKVFLHKNSNVLIPIPTFSEYEAASRLNGARISFFKTMNLNKNILDLQDFITKTKCIFVCNPNNPTGVLISKKNLLKILESAYNK